MTIVRDLDKLVYTANPADLGVSADIHVNPNSSPPIIQAAPGFNIDADDGVDGPALYSWMYWLWQFRIKLRFDDTTSTGPGAGLLRFNNANPALATAIYVNQVDASSESQIRAEMLDTMVDGDYVSVVKTSADWTTDPDNIARYTINGSVTSAGGVYTIPVTYVSGAGSFTDNDQIILSPQSPFAGVDMPLETISANSGEFLLNQTANKAWEFADQTTIDLLRNFAWDLVGSDGTVLESYMNITSLGQPNNPTDQPKYWQESGTDVTPTDTVRTGSINQSVMIYSAPTRSDVNYRSFFKVGLKEQGDTQVVVNLLTELALSTLTARIYAFPLSSVTDGKISTLDVGIDSNADGTPDVSPFDQFSIDWSGGSVDIGDGNGSQPYNRAIVDVNNANTSWNQIHEYLSWVTRQLTDVDDSATTRIGFLEEPLSRFDGDRFVTSAGVVVINYVPQDVNNVASEVSFTDSNSVVRTPNNPDFVSQKTIIFNDVAQANANSQFWCYIASTYNTATPVLLEDNGGTPITDFVNGRSSIVVDFGYDTNTQLGRTPGNPLDVVFVIIGADGTKWVTVDSTFDRSTTGEVRLSPAFDRNWVDVA
jgi:hypothetical protein